MSEVIHTRFTMDVPSCVLSLNAAAWSPNVLAIASGADDETMHIWDAANASTIFIYCGHVSKVEALAWSPDDLRIASGSKNDTVQVWQAIELNL